MGLFNKKKASIKKTVKGDETQAFINYFNVKNKSEFELNLFRDLIGENLCLIVIDTRYNFDASNKNVEEDAVNLLNQLDENNIRYNKIISYSNASMSIFGLSIKLDSKNKVRNYTIGIIAAADELEKIEGMLEKFSAFYYVADITNEDEIFEKFNAVQGDMEELMKQFSFNFFKNNFTSQVLVRYSNDKADYVDKVLQNK